MLWPETMHQALLAAYITLPEILIGFLSKYENGLQAYVQAYQISCHVSKHHAIKAKWLVFGGRASHTWKAINRLEVGDVFTLQKKKSLQ
jgi:hypothetical protein